MKNIIFLFVLHVFLVNQLHSQNEFIKKINVLNNDYGTYVIQTKDGGYLLTGITEDANYNDNILLVKTNMYGDTIWTKIYDSEYQCSSVCVKETFDNGFIINGNIRTYSTPDMGGYLIKTDEFGDTLWTRIFYYDYFYQTIQTNDSSYFCVGGGVNNSAITRLDNSGNIIWSKHFNFSKRFIDCQEISENRIIVAGLSRMPDEPFTTTIDLFMTNNNGDSVWFHQYGNPYTIFDYISIKQTIDKGFILASTQSYYLDHSDIYIQKVDSLGDSLWSRTYGDEYSFDEARSIVQTSDSGFVIAGQLRDSEQILLKIDRVGNLLWKRDFNNDSLYGTYGYCINKTNDNHLIIAGRVFNSLIPFPPSDILLIKTDEEGLLTNTFDSHKDPKKDCFIYPNPNNGHFSLLLPTGDINLKIFDLNGKIIYEEQMRFIKNQTIKIGKIDKGCYIVYVTAKNYSTSEKIIVF